MTDPSVPADPLELIARAESFHSLVNESQYAKRTVRELADALAAQREGLVMVARLVNSYHLDETRLTAAETLREIASVLLAPLPQTHTNIHGELFTDDDLKRAGQDWGESAALSASPEGER